MANLVQKRNLPERSREFDEFNDEDYGEDDDDYETLIARGRAAQAARAGLDGPLPDIDHSYDRALGLPPQGECKAGAELVAPPKARPKTDRSAPRGTSSGASAAEGGASSSSQGAGIRGTTKDALAAKRARYLEERKMRKERQQEGEGKGKGGPPGGAAPE